MPMKSIYRTILAVAGSFLAAQFGGDIATVTVHIKKIREKIEYDTSKPQYIETI